MTQTEFFSRYKWSSKNDRIGGGSFGDVYKAFDSVLDTYVAIKVAAVKYAGDKTFSLKDEMDAVGTIPKNTYVANYDAVYSFETPQGLFDYAIIQYYPEGNMKNLIENKQLTTTQKEDLVLKLLEGLDFLHRHKIVHRDLKPSNILISKREQDGKQEYIPKIADFGLSKKANSGEMSRFTNSFGGGTLEYSSPEQLKGEELRLNTDIWAFGAIVYEVFSGTPLFKSIRTNSNSAAGERELIDLILGTDVKDKLSVLPGKWQQIAAACLVRNPEQRVKDTQMIKEWTGQSVSIGHVETISSQKDRETKIIDGNKPVSKEPINPEFEKKEEIELIPPKKNKNILWLILFLGAVAAGTGFWYWNKKQSSTITIENAREIYETVQRNQVKGDIDSAFHYYAGSLERYFSLENISALQVKETIKAYYLKWKTENIEILSFTESGENRFVYEANIESRKLENNKIYKNKVKGEIRFVKEEGAFKINYINDFENVRNYAVFLIDSSKYSNTFTNTNRLGLKYSSSILLFNSISDQLLLNHLYKDILGENNYSDWTREEYFKAQQKAGELNFTQLSNETEPDPEVTMDNFYTSINMNIRFTDQNFLSLEYESSGYSGGAHGFYSNSYKNVDYRDKKMLFLNDLVNVKSIDWNQLLRRCLNKYSKYSDGSVISDTELFEPEKLNYTENFYFDNENIWFVYNPYEIASFAQGIIEIKVPFSELQSVLTPYFSEKIKNSQKTVFTTT